MTRISFPSMLTSGGILTVCGYVVFFMSTGPAICEVGHLIGRGAVLSVFFVTTLMPSILIIIDRFIVTDFKTRHEERRERFKSRISTARGRIRGDRERRRRDIEAQIEKLREALKKHDEENKK